MIHCDLILCHIIAPVTAFRRKKMYQPGESQLTWISSDESSKPKQRAKREYIATRQAYSTSQQALGVCQFLATSPATTNMLCVTLSDSFRPRAAIFQGKVDGNIVCIRCSRPTEKRVERIHVSLLYNSALPHVLNCTHSKRYAATKLQSLICSTTNDTTLSITKS
jgi:hypothetical protein